MVERELPENIIDEWSNAVHVCLTSINKILSTESKEYIPTKEDVENVKMLAEVAIRLTYLDLR